MASDYDRIRQAEKIQEEKGRRGESTGRDANRGPYEEHLRKREEDARFWEGTRNKSLPQGSPVPRPYGGRSGPGLFGWLDGKLAPEERDISFANFVGGIVGVWLFWVAYRRGFTGEWYWNFIVPIGGGAGSAWLVRSVPFVTRPLRRAAVGIVWVALVWVAYILLVNMLSA